MAHTTTKTPSAEHGEPGSGAPRRVARRVQSWHRRASAEGDEGNQHNGDISVVAVLGGTLLSMRKPTS